MKFNTQDKQPTRVLASAWILGTIILLGLTMGVWQFFGALSLIKAVQESLILLLFCYSLWSVRNPAATIQNPIVWPLFGLTLAALISAYVQNTGVIELALFLRETILFFLVFLAMRNLELPSRYMSGLYYLVGVIFLIQLPVSWLKYYFYGIAETLWIGTLHQSAGQLGLLFPLFVIAVLMAYGLTYRRNIMAIFLLITLYGLFAVICEKRGIVYTFPLLVIALLMVGYYSERCSFDRAKPLMFYRRHRHLMLATAASSIITIGFSMITIKSLNPSLDNYLPAGTTCLHANQKQQRSETYLEQLSCRLSYLLLYSKDYLIRGYSHPLNLSAQTVESNTNIQLGRLQLIYQTFIYKIKQNPIEIGLGSGPSSVSTSYILGQNREDILFERTGLRGPSPSIVKILLELGFLGGACILFWFALVGLKLLQSIKNNELKPKPKFLILCLVGLHGILVFDFFLYSQVIWTQGVLIPLYFILLAELYRSDSGEKLVSVTTAHRSPAPSK